MCIYVIPRLNPYGAYKNQRNTYSVSSSGNDAIDPNGDFLRLRMTETRLRQKALLLFDPDVAMDGHEYTMDMESSSMKHKDIMLATHYLPFHTEEFQEQALAIAYAAIGKLGDNGLAYGWYTDVVNNASGAVGSGNVAYQGTLHLLMESQGIRGGLYSYERRVIARSAWLLGF